mmetsp:Transcript_24080/g.67834  ORF Transcript_24080/g.67834 Transcript_24080/m.67834 type:complete len:225 (+) Transcript_24080:337-1011(+)
MIAPRVFTRHGNAGVGGTVRFLQLHVHPIQAAPGCHPCQSGRFLVERVHLVDAQETDEDGARALRHCHAFMIQHGRMQQHLSHLLGRHPRKRLFGHAIPEPRAASLETVVQQYVEGNVRVSHQVRSFVIIVPDDEHIIRPNRCHRNAKYATDQRCQPSIQLFLQIRTIILCERIRDQIQIRRRIIPMTMLLPSHRILQKSFHRLVETFVVITFRRRKDFIHALQ